ncbi:hypothetical protein CTA2_407 [Colletotrichum tanaceti]|nr:hypothetical protein CTA2_407 [Colletotrichum tanaceti]
MDSWPFSCVVPSQGTQRGRAWVTSICSVSQAVLGHNAFQDMPKFIGSRYRDTTMFLVFKSSGSALDWQRVVEELGNITNVHSVTHSAAWEANAADWTTSADGIWARVHLPGTNYSMSVSACFTVLGAEILNVSMSSDSNGPEPSLVWDNATARFNVDVIRNLYLGSRDDAPLMSSRGVLKLDHREPEAKPNYLRLSAAASRLPSMGRLITDASRWQEWNCGTLGNDSSRPLHYSHSVLFQDIFQTTGSLAEALQAVLMVARQMEYYEYAPQVWNMWSSPASYVMAAEMVIPVQWLGFGIVVGMIGVHFVLVFATAALFLTLTKASRIGNVWMAISQVVSAETEDMIQKATLEDDSRIESMIQQAKNMPGSGLRNRVQVRKNDVNERYEIASVR